MRWLTPMKLLRLRFVCGMAMDAEVPPIWREIAQAPTKGAALSILNQYLWAGREVCRRQFFGATDMMHDCGALFMFVHGDRFMNPGADPACPQEACLSGRRGKARASLERRSRKRREKSPRWTGQTSATRRSHQRPG